MKELGEIGLKKKTKQKSFLRFILFTMAVILGAGYLSANRESIPMMRDLQGLRMNEALLQTLLGVELPAKNDQKPFSTGIDRLLVFLFGINPKDPTTLLATEVPGLSGYRGVFLEEGKEGNFSDLPRETEPTPEMWAKQESDAILPDEAPKTVVVSADQKPPTVYIYHTHNRESWISEVKGAKSDSEAMSAARNITLVGQALAESLKKEGISVLHDQTDIYALLKKTGNPYSLSYAKSLEVVETAQKDHHALQYFFDIHRDAIGRDKTTTKINGIDYAKIMFVVGKGNKNWKENFQFAESLQKKLEEMYPGITRPIVGYEKSRGHNGEYNQSISANAITVEIGGIGNTFDESVRSANALAKAFTSLYYGDAVPALKQEEVKKNE